MARGLRTSYIVNFLVDVSSVVSGKTVDVN
jgi:hypothetical protein